MPQLMLPPGQEIRLYASDAFLTSAHEAGARQLDINPAEVRDVLQIARASETIPSLGGIALFSPDEARAASREFSQKNVSNLGETALAQQLMLTQFANSQPVGRDSWGRIITGHIEEKTSLFSLGVEPDEVKIAASLYDAAFLLPGKPGNDSWVGQRLTMAGGLLAFGLGFNVAGAGLAVAGQSIGRIRRWVDHRTIGEHRPILLRGQVSE